MPWLGHVDARKNKEGRKLKLAVVKEKNNNDSSTKERNDLEKGLKALHSLYRLIRHTGITGRVLHPYEPRAGQRTTQSIPTEFYATASISRAHY